MMVGRRLRKAIDLAALIAALGLLPSPAQAAVHSLTSTRVVQSTMLWLTLAGPCLLLSYDRNGNRTSQTIDTATSGSAEWGAGTFGCFVWGR